jgi:hypothetical protein
LIRISLATITVSIFLGLFWGIDLNAAIDIAKTERTEHPGVAYWYQTLPTETLWDNFMANVVAVPLRIQVTKDACLGQIIYRFSNSTEH